MDLVMNTGIGPPYYTAAMFVEFLCATRNGEAGLEGYRRRYPEAARVRMEATRRAPASYAQVCYHAQQAFRLAARNGRPPDYLRQELRQRAAGPGVHCLLQLQLYEVRPETTEEVLHPGRAWDERDDPWLDLATVTLDRPLPDAETERLRFNVGNQPPSPGLVEPQSLEDYSSLAYLRAGVYGRAQAFRLLRL